MAAIPRKHSAPWTPLAASSAASSVTSHLEPASYPRIPPTRPKFDMLPGSRFGHHHDVLKLETILESRSSSGEMLPSRARSVNSATLRCKASDGRNAITDSGVVPRAIKSRTLRKIWLRPWLILPEPVSLEARVGIELRRPTQAAYLIETTMLRIRT